MPRYSSPSHQYLDDAGNPLAYGKLYFFKSGTNTDQDTFADVNLLKKNTNPVMLTASGRTPNIFLGSGSYKVVLTKNDDTQIWERDPVGGSDDEGAFSSWNSLTIYDIPDIVVGSDGLFYISIKDGNQGNDPVTDNNNWTEIRFIRVYNPNEVYSTGRIVQDGSGNLYRSLQDANLNNPLSDELWWAEIGGGSIELPLVQATALSF